MANTPVFSFQKAITTLPLNSLTSEPYQRPVQPLRVKKMINNYKPNSNAPIYVNARDERYIIVDGQHRAAMMKGLGFSEIQAILFSHPLTVAEEAEAYHYYSRESKPSSLYNDYSVQLQAGDLATTEIERAVLQNDFAVTNKSDHSPKTIRAVKTLRDIHQKAGASSLSNILRIWRYSWPNIQPEQTSLLALARFYIAYHDHPDYNDAQLINRLQKLPVSTLMLTAHAATKLIHGSAERHLFEEILQAYNKGRRTHRLPDLTTPSD